MEQINEQNPVTTQEPVVTPPEFNPVVARPTLGFKEAVKICWSKYADFTGRARRSEYWWFYLFTFLVMLLPILVIIFSALIGAVSGGDDIPTGWLIPIIIAAIVLFVMMLVFLVPTLAVQTRRLHDTGRSGWWIVANYAISFVASFVRAILLDFNDFAGTSKGAIAVCVLLYLINLGIGIAIFVFTLLDSHKGENQYGPSPKYQ